MRKIFLLVLPLLFVLILSGCLSAGKKKGRTTVSRSLADEGIKTEKQLCKFFLANRPDADKEQVKRLAHYYVEEAKFEGINSDCAFVQMCLETGFLKFGNLVKPEMHNYCGLGAIDAAHPGVSFETEQEGVRAHIQHLHAYATTSNIKLKNIVLSYISSRLVAVQVSAAATPMNTISIWTSSIKMPMTLFDCFTKTVTS